MGFKAGSALSRISPVLALAVFWWLPFKRAVIVYVLITGLAYVLLKWIELRRLSLEVDEIFKGRYPSGPSKEKILEVLNGCHRSGLPDGSGRK